MTKEEKNRKVSGQTSRRKFLKDAGIIVGGATVGSLGIMSACSGGVAQPETVTNNVTNAENLTNAGRVNTTDNVTGDVTTPVKPPPIVNAGETTAPPTAVDLEVFNPSGNQEITQLFAPRLSTLEGKTVAFLACDPVKWQPHRIFPVIMEEFKKLYPTIKFLPMDEFTRSTNISSDSVIKTVADRGADAVITGSAG